MSEIQTSGKKRSTMDNIVVVSAITEQRRIETSNTYIFFADAVKCFDKLWLQDCIIEVARLGYSKNDLEIIYKLNETAQVKINKPYGDTENIEIKEVVKQVAIYGPIMCCASTARVNEIGEKVIWQYRNRYACLYGQHCSNRGCRQNKKRNQELQKNGNREKNTKKTEKRPNIWR